MPRPKLEQLLERKSRLKTMLRECTAVEDQQHAERILEELQDISLEIFELSQEGHNLV